MATRPPAVAGLFYPADPTDLAHLVRDLLAAAAPTGADPARLRAVIAPHAGYVYSGSTAAAAYGLIAAAAARIERVVLLGPTHRVAVRGCALPGVDAFTTPLGDVPVEDAPQVAALPQVVTSARVHAQEHSLEVHLPFLQCVLGSFTVLPIAVGEASPQEVAQVIDAAGVGADTLIVASSDLSHYLPYEQARAADAATLRAWEALRPVAPRQACGAYPVGGVLEVAARRGWRARLLAACTSGDTAGDRARVVGYAAVALEGDLP